MLPQQYRGLIPRALALDPMAAAAKAAAKIAQALSVWRHRRADSQRMTYCSSLPFSAPMLYEYFGAMHEDTLAGDTQRIGALNEHWLNHRLDLLGSGWVQIAHGISCRGLEGLRYASGPPVSVDRDGSWLNGRIPIPNLPESRRVWRLVQGEYLPIDWQLDFKSGYRWSERTWYGDVRYGHRPGADIKVPWELARMQHLPQLALAHALAVRGAPSLRSPEVYATEFRNQVLDFIATNPPRWGVNWASTMDVAIRVANWLVAHDLFRGHRAEFDPEFIAIFARSVYEHGCHIVRNLEWSPEARGNHYLADVVGLLFVAAYLPRTPQIDAWLAFGIQELVAEVRCQFTPDGGNFEASTSYHRLSAELVVHATALALALPAEKQRALQTYDHRLKRDRPQLRPAPLPFFPAPDGIGSVPFPAWYFERLERMAEFTMHATKPSGRVLQIGDSDNGRFLKLNPAVVRRTAGEAKRRYANLAEYADLADDEPYWDEDHLDHRCLIAAFSALFDRPDFGESTGRGVLQAAVLRSLMHGRRFPSYRKPGECCAAERRRIGSVSELADIADEFERASPDQRQSIDIPAPGKDLCDGLSSYAYPNFGLFVFSSVRLYLAVRCGSAGQSGIGAHAHNDQLSIELSVDRHDLIRDPGTYLYTPLPDRRNEYRSVRAHFAPQLEGREPARLDLGLFRLKTEGVAECLFFGREGFAGVWRGHRRSVRYMLLLAPDAIQVRYVAHGCHLMRPTSLEHAHWTNFLPKIAYSPGYGQLLRRREETRSKILAATDSALHV